MRMIKPIFGALALSCAALAATSGTARAEGSFSGNVALTSDYVFRGLSQTDGGAAIQGGFDYENGIFYAGVWASNVNFGASGPSELASMELDAYAGITPSTGPVDWDLGVIGYFYPNADDELAGGEFDFFEAKVAAAYEVTPQFEVGAGIYYSPEFTGETGEAIYAEISASYAFTDAIAVSGAYGNQDVDALGDYDTWNIGASYAIHGFELDLRYHDADTADDIVAFTISRSI